MSQLGHSRPNHRGLKSTVVRYAPKSDHSRDKSELTLSANFSRAPPFLLRELSYMRELPPKRADSP